VPHTPQQNGVAECKNRVINDAIHAQLAEADLPKCLWSDCAAHAVFTLNIISLTASDISTYKLWSGKELPLSTLYCFGTEGYVYLPKANHKGKLDNRSTKVLLVGYGEMDGKRAYKVVDQSIYRSAFYTRDFRPIQCR
jgi:hypothetical protein